MEGEVYHDALNSQWSRAPGHSVCLPKLRQRRTASLGPRGFVKRRHPRQVPVRLKPCTPRLMADRLYKLVVGPHERPLRPHRPSQNHETLARYRKQSLMKV